MISPLCYRLQHMNIVYLLRSNTSEAKNQSKTDLRNHSFHVEDLWMDEKARHRAPEQCTNRTADKNQQTD